MNSLTQEQRREILRLCKTGTDSVRYSLQRSDQQTLRRAWDVVGLFSVFFLSILPSTEGFQRISAFGIYNHECTFLLRRAL
ncbi:MAG: hypothetical protein Q7S58_02950, partial [Candidatus Binatus sp.]|uniref:hypothetical protein n=1 Tax=Candidatus Binatus sp. TaxID=2811406 RepID=UPI002721DC88